MEHYLFYSVIGLLIIFLVQKSPYLNIIELLVGSDKVRGFLRELISCNLCLGCWIYPILAFLMNVNILNDYIPVISELVTGWSSSFIMYLLVIGWKERFGTFIIN